MFKKVQTKIIIAAISIAASSCVMAQNCTVPSSLNWVGSTGSPTSLFVNGTLAQTGGSPAAAYYQNCTTGSLAPNGTQWLAFSFTTTNYFNNYFNGYFPGNTPLADHMPIFMRWNYSDAYSNGTNSIQYTGRGVILMKEYGPLGEFTDLQAGLASVQTTSQTFPNSNPLTNLTGFTFVDNRQYNVVIQAAATGVAFTVTDTVTGQQASSYFSETPNTNLGANTGLSLWVLCRPQVTGRSDSLCDGMSYRVDISNMTAGWFN